MVLQLVNVKLLCVQDRYITISSKKKKIDYLDCTSLKFY